MTDDGTKTARDTLREMLERSEIQSVAIAMVDADGTLGTAYYIDGQRGSLLRAVEHLAHRLLTEDEE